MGRLSREKPPLKNLKRNTMRSEERKEREEKRRGGGRRRGRRPAQEEEKGEGEDEDGEVPRVAVESVADLHDPLENRIEHIALFQFQTCLREKPSILHRGRMRQEEEQEQEKEEEEEQQQEEEEEEEEEEKQQSEEEVEERVEVPH